MSCQTKHDVPQTIELHNNWEFKKVTDSNWNSATVPGNVHSDLLENNLIENPFIGNNEHDLQWISETDWEYKTTFSVDKKTLQKQNIELNFKGLDTYASIFLNDSLILKTNNAFREFQVDVKPLLKTENILRILFENTTKFEEQEKAKLGYSLPEGNRIFTRKAQFQYGWDWGPKLNTSGIWRPVKLVAWNDFKIDDFYVKQLKLNDSIADLVLDIKKISSIELDKSLTYNIYINDLLYKTSSEVLKGHTWATRLLIKNPKRWWPHNLGEPYLYDIKVVVKKGNAILDSISTKIGLRTIELVTKKDSVGESFYFKVNDVPVYAKGANYIPQNSMQNKVTDAHYEKLLDDAVDANMNMLRVWGGGIYENDIFYDLCDKKGILVWQDFMFACAMYPGDKDYLQNVQQEAIDNLKRLRNHASIALWCGNNENSEGWHRWGWQDGRSESEKEEIWSNYLKVFDSILPNTVAKLTDTYYWESSPKYGRGNPKYEFEGDAHDWWIWHDGYPFEHLEERVPRFMSEFGMQSFPSYEVINYINQSDSLEITSEGFKNHQKHVRGFQLIDEYMQRDFPVPTQAEDYVYMSQVVQAYGITKGLEAQRRAKPYNMGTLFWQLNDCWPSISWSSIDFFGNWKALHYKAKKSFENVLVSPTIKDNVLKTFVINDNLTVTDTLHLKLIDFSGKELWSFSKEVTALENSSDLMHELNLEGIDKKNAVLVSSFNNTTSTYFLAKPKDLKLQQAEITKEITKTSSGFKVKLSSSTLQKDVFLFTKEKGHFSDNFFDLLPNKILEIDFTTEAETLNDLKIKTLNNFIN
ncbi:glycoside hydrolase family 2 protein [Flavobacteriaceae bacterium S0825]|uniref:beta-mannosidase n=1 Tax=Gaetbulibacter sp. S0825 TaxID=2720084 RepID=UPI001FCAE998|nr:glycoside hydrolase family 2 protein [Gaetbulibacter sp. S0825]MCK0109171.1 glycoside hydrolase family 2 protein [Flavobacteriaceae bacterium S0825]